MNQMATVQETYGNHREAILYILVGGFTTVISLLSYMLFVWMGIELNISNILSWISGVLFAFVTNKWIVFESKSTEKVVVAKELGSFFSARIFTGLIAIILFPILVGLGLGGSFMGTDGFLAKIITSLIEIIMNWIFSKYYIFKKKSEPSV